MKEDLTNMVKGTTEKGKCSCCGRTVPLKSSRACQSCGKVYHKKCFLRDSGLDATQHQACICCVCPSLPQTIPTAVTKQSKYAADFLENGFCVIPLPATINGEATAELLQKWNDSANAVFHGFMHAYDCQAIGSSGVPSLDGGYSNFRRRGEGRFEMISDEISSKVVPLVEGCAGVQAALDVLLSFDRKRMSSGCFYSMHGSQKQVYHMDGPPLSEVVDLYPYAINVFVPLVPVDGKNGTEFIPESQRVTSQKTEKDRSARPSVGVGNVILFDYRVIHRGLGNAMTAPRPCYYVTYSRKWYTDKYNFSEQRYKRPLAVDPVFMETREERLRRRHEKL